MRKYIGKSNGKKKRKKKKKNQNLRSWTPFAMLKIHSPVFGFFNARPHQQPTARIQDRLAEEKTRHRPVGHLVLGPAAALVALAAAAAAAGLQVLSYDSSAADCGNISGKPRRLRER